jgi:hypothetical protein
MSGAYGVVEYGHALTRLQPRPVARINLPVALAHRGACVATPRALKNFSTCSWPSGLRHTLETSPLSCMEGSMPSPSEGRLAAAVVPPTWVMTFFMSRVALNLDCVVDTDLFCLKASVTMRCTVLSLRCWVLRGPASMLRVPVVVVDDLPLLLLLLGLEARLPARLNIGGRGQHALAKLTPGHVGQAQLLVFIELLLQAVDELVRDGARLALNNWRRAGCPRCARSNAKRKSSWW